MGKFFLIKGIYKKVIFGHQVLVVLCFFIKVFYPKLPKFTFFKLFYVNLSSFLLIIRNEHLNYFVFSIILIH